MRACVLDAFRLGSFVVWMGADSHLYTPHNTNLQAQRPRGPAHAGLGRLCQRYSPNAQHPKTAACLETHSPEPTTTMHNPTHLPTGTPPASLPRATLVAEVATPPAVEAGLGSSRMGFPGIWADGLLRDCWAPDDRWVGRFVFGVYARRTDPLNQHTTSLPNRPHSAIYLTSTWGSRSALLRVALQPSSSNGGVAGLTGWVEPLAGAAEAAGIGCEGLPAGERADASVRVWFVSLGWLTGICMECLNLLFALTHNATGLAPRRLPAGPARDRLRLQQPRRLWYVPLSDPLSKPTPNRS